MERPAYSPLLRDLMPDDRLFELGPGRPVEAMREKLAGLTVETIAAPRPLRPRDAAEACLGALWLFHDFLDESHTISQSLTAVEGSYWHAIMHRREPDAANSKYWFRSVGAHPVISRLVAQAPALGLAYQTPFDFVDLCERVRGSGTPDELAAKRVQKLEWQLLFDHCYLAATGEGV